MTTKHIDLRCERRLTVNEARIVLAALEGVSPTPKLLIAKLADAVMRATHKCTGRLCPVCKRKPSDVAAMRKRRAKDLMDRLAASRKLDAELCARRRANLSLAKY